MDVYFSFEIFHRLRLLGSSARTAVRAIRGAENMVRASENASSIGDVPRASTATWLPPSTSSMTPRAMVRVPSERISTTKRATTGGSSRGSRALEGAFVGFEESDDMMRIGAFQRHTMHCSTATHEEGRLPCPTKSMYQKLYTCPTSSSIVRANCQRSERWRLAPGRPPTTLVFTET